MPKPVLPDAPPLGRLCKAADHRLALHHQGQGGPAVIFLPGAGLIGLDYLNVHAGVAKFTASVLYDRAGTGWSDAIKLPRTAAATAEELHTLLNAAGIAPPYLLVGHSLGGAYARRFAQLYPAEVAAILFLDPADEGYETISPKQTLGEQIGQVWKLLGALVNMKAFYRPMFERMLHAWPQAVRGPLVDYHLKYWRRSLDEAKNLQTDVFREIRNGGPMPDVPLIVLTAMGVDPFMAAFASERYLRELNAAKQPIYDALARSVPGGENRLLEDAGHSTLHTDRPDAVVGAIRDLLERVQA